MNEIHGKDRVFIYFIVFLCIFILSCNNKNKFNERNLETTYGISFNPVRRFVGLDTLSTKWEYKELFVQKRFCRIDWFDKSIFTNKNYVSGFLFKTIWFQFDIPIKEADSYVLSPRIDSQKNIEFDKMVAYIYQFVADIDSNIGWRFYYQTDSLENVRGYITKQQADSILHSWGVQRQGSVW